MDGVFSIDVEPDLSTNKTKGIKSLNRLILILNRAKIKATLFTTGEILERFPNLFVKIKKQGHEIAIHGYSHKRLDFLSKKEKENEIKKSVFIYKNIFKENPMGFRAPQHSIDSETINLLEKYNFKYDSSRTPLNAMLLRHLMKRKSNKKSILTNFLSKLKPYKLKNDLFEIPRSMFLISTGGFELKVYPKTSYKLIISFCRLFNIPFIFVMHSWDMIEIPGSRTSKQCSKECFEKKLFEFIEYSSLKINYLPMEKFYEKTKNN